MNLPRHITLSLRHNPHAGDYTQLETWLENYLLAADAGGEPRDEAIAPEDLAAIRAAGEVWELSWCPNRPVGSCSAVAATLERVLELAGGDAEPPPLLLQLVIAWHTAREVSEVRRHLHDTEETLRVVRVAGAELRGHLLAVEEVLRAAGFGAAVGPGPRVAELVQQRDAARRRVAELEAELNRLRAAGQKLGR